MRLLWDLLWASFFVFLSSATSALPWIGGQGDPRRSQGGFLYFFFIAL